MREGAVALAALPQADGSRKNRPVILLRQLPPFGDWLVCGVSTQLRQHVARFDELIENSAPDFLSSGLKASSVIRLGFLAVLSEANLIGVIGLISQERHRQLLNRLSEHLSA
ncbi:MAG: type II toxin-antitoxin system PemK/MazF family toxin [Blastocatellia bacterium]|nr:type II toxin-antitoxin system PemK/MazF family toxin [Blastocatellia bacterium]